MPVSMFDVLSLPQARRISDTVFSGPTLEGNLQYLLKLKQAGIDTVVDFRGDATNLLSDECQKVGLKYFKFSLDHIFKSGKNECTPQFVSGLKQFFDIMNRGRAYIGCQFGIHRTNAALAYNFFLNPQSKNAPNILPWHEGVSMKSTINMLVKMIRKSVKNMTEDQRQAINIFGSGKEIFNNVFKEKIGRLISQNMKYIR